MQGIDRDTFRLIFEEHWDEFKSLRPSFATQYYDDLVSHQLNKCTNRPLLNFGSNQVDLGGMI